MDIHPWQVEPTHILQYDPLLTFQLLHQLILSHLFYFLRFFQSPTDGICRELGILAMLIAYRAKSAPFNMSLILNFKKN